MKWTEKIEYKVWMFFKRLEFKKFGKDILSVFGGLWLIIEILAYFGQREWADNIRSIWWLILIIGLIILIYRNRPKSIYSFKVHNRDVFLTVRIGDVFKIKGSLIIPINNRLDCDNGGIIKKSNSILRYFIENAYEDTPSHLNTDISQHIDDNLEWYGHYVENENPKTYKVGTVVPIFRNEKQYYLLCSSTLNKSGRSKTTVDNLRESLNELWSFLTSNGSKDNLIIPIIGTGRGRITLGREEVIKEIVLSFLVSLSQNSYCDQLTICIHPNDLKRNNMNLDGLLDFVRLNCDNTVYLKGDGMPTGIGID